MKAEQKKLLRIASGGGWISLHPGLQHTVYADMVLSNQFDSLVGESDKGLLIPLGAKNWSISPDYKVFQFEIDIAKKFSDGSELTSYDYKASWEESLKLDPHSNNNSLLDILYNLEGFENFSKLNTISGIETPNKSLLTLKFKSPFRMAIDHLQGNRFSAFKKDSDGNYIGTGNYIITKLSDDELILNPNPYHNNNNGVAPIKLSIVRPVEAIEKIRKNELDVLAYSFSSYFPSLPEDKNIRIIPGHEAGHETIFLNGMKERFFQNSKYRLAMQYLILKEFNKSKNPLKNEQLFKMDNQIYLPYQKGRLDNLEVEKIILEGAEYVDEMLAESKKFPVIIYSYDSREWFFELVKKTGISISNKSKIVSRSELLKIIYKTNEVDIVPTTFSLAGNDPDNIYHALGKSGAILSKMVYRKDLADLLEVGRQITDLNLINSHYKKVSESVLRQVPFIHLGFSKSIYIYSQDRIKVTSDFVRSNFGHLNIFLSC